MISSGVFLYFFLIIFLIFVNIKILTFFIGPLQQFFLTNSCFSSSSINAKQKFWGVSHLHMCVIFYSLSHYSNKRITFLYKIKNQYRSLKSKSQTFCHFLQFFNSSVKFFNWIVCIYNEFQDVN